MENNFDLRKFLTENKLTANSKLLSEQSTIEPQQGDKAAYEKLSKLFDWDDINPDLGVEFSDEYGLEEFPEWEDQTWTDEIEGHIKEQGAQMKKIATVGIKGRFIDEIHIYDIDGKYAALIDDYNQGCTVTSLQKGQELIQQAQDIVNGSGMNENSGQVKVGDQVEYDGDQWVVVSIHGDEVDIVEIGQDGYTVQAGDVDERNPKVGDFVSGPGIDSNEALVVGISEEGIDVMELTDNGISVSMSDLQGGMNEGQFDLSSEESIMQAIEDAAQNYMDDDTSREEAMALAAEDIYDLARGEGNEDAMAIANSIIRGGMNESRRRSAGRRLNESKR